MVKNAERECMSEKKSGKALFFDIDGTVLSEQTNMVPESAAAAIRAARQQGHLTFINTGRTLSCLPGVLLDMDFTGFLCGCGTDVVYQGEHLYDRQIPREDAVILLRMLDTYRMGAVLEGRDRIYFQSETSRFPAIQSILTQFRNVFPVQVGWNDPFPVFSKLIVLGDRESRDQEFCREASGLFDVIDRGTRFYELVPKGHSKAAAIAMVLERFGLRREDAWVFGDSSNDLSMFQAVPNAVAMGKHDAVLTPYASYIAPTVEEDGLYRAMVDLSLIPDLGLLTVP